MERGAAKLARDVSTTTGRYQRMNEPYRPNLPLGNLDHLIVSVHDLDGEIAFWRDVVGLGCIKASPTWAEFRFGDRVLALQSLKREGQATPRDTEQRPQTSTHPTFELSMSVTDLSESLSRLATQDVHISASPREICSTDGLAYLYAYFDSPNGIKCSMYQRVTKP